MARFLFAVWPAPGHVYPSLAIANTLRLRGHAIAYVTNAEFRKVIESCDHVFLPLGESLAGDDGDAVRQAVQPRRPDTAHEARNLFRALFVTPAPGQAHAIGRAVTDFRPDVLVHDQRSFAPSLVAEQAGLPLATLALTCCPLPGRDLAPFGLGLPPARDDETRTRYALLRRQAEESYAEITQEWNAIRAGFGLPPHHGPLASATVSRDLLLLLSVPELDYERSDLPPQARYVGPCSWDPPALLDEATASWLAALPPERPLALVTASTARAGRFADARSAVLVEAAMMGLQELGMAVLATLPFEHPLHQTASTPSTRIVRFAPHSHMLPRAAVAIAHGGFGIVTKALAHGVPLVVAPFVGDQPEVAARVVAAGAGIQLKQDAVTPALVAQATAAILHQGAYRAAARRVAAAMARYQGPAEAAAHLEELAVTQTLQWRPTRVVEATS